MANQEDFNHLITALAADVNGFIGASIVDIESGMPLASASHRADFDLDVASAYNSEMVKAKLKTISALGLNAQLEDMLLTLDSQLHLVKLLTPGMFLYLAAERSVTNLAMLRSTVNRVTKDFAV